MISGLTDLINCEDAIPDMIVHDGKYKVRKAWFASIGWHIRRLEKHHLSNETTKSVADFKARFFCEDFKVKELVTREDIDYANQFVGELLAELKERE